MTSRVAAERSTVVSAHDAAGRRAGKPHGAQVRDLPAGRYTAQQVTDHVGATIARFKRPHVVVFTDALPRTRDGAVDREAVKTAWGNATA